MASLSSDIWRGRKILVTGHTGFKGTWLCKILEKFGAEVYGYALDPQTQPSHFEFLSWRNLQHVTGDIRDFQKVTSYFRDCRPEFVFHLAAQPLVLSSYQDPRYTYETNVLGTLNVLEAVRNTPSVKGAIIVTSDKCYENLETVRPYREEDPMGGYDPYSSSKGCAEILTASYRRSFFNVEDYGIKHSVLLASVRAGNVIGGGDWSDNRLIPDFARAFRDGRKVQIRSPHAVRPWQHVLEPIKGYILLGAKLLDGQMGSARAFNFGPDSSGFWKVSQILDFAKKIWPEFDYEVVESKSHEAGLLTLDSSLAHQELNWRPMLSTEHAVEWTLDWYREFIRDGKTLTDRQIDKFFD